MLPLNAIIHRDCFDFMRGLPNKCIDHVITDPPYSEKAHKGARTGNRDKVLVNFDSISQDEFLILCKELVRITKRWIVMTCDWRYIAAIEDAGLPLIRFGVWVKPNGMPQMSGDRPSAGWEAIAILHDKGRKKWNGGGFPAVYNYNKIEGQHPTQKPLPLIQKIIIQFTDEGDTILDPFSGSGTTAIACHNFKRNFICIEKDDEYYAASVKRLEQHQRQGMLTL